MNDPYSIIDVRQEWVRDVEQLGSKPKVWFEMDGTRWLFKEARENTGENWAEKVASEVAALLDLPTHHVELAVRDGRMGCAAKSFLTGGQILVHGNELLGGIITGYDKDKERGQSDHTFDNIVTVLECLFETTRPRTAACLRMVGYLVLDALVGNTDRHHQNWGVVLEPRRGEDGVLRIHSMHLAPTFDHASSLGRELTDEARKRLLDEAALERYARRGKGGIFGESSARHGLSPIAVVELLAVRYPNFLHPWREKLRALGEPDFKSIIDRVPGALISPNARAFVLAFLEFNRRLILSLP
jgi:hypothetical protein